MTAADTVFADDDGVLFVADDAVDEVLMFTARKPAPQEADQAA